MPGENFIKNFEELATTPQRHDTLMIAQAGLEAIDTVRVLKQEVYFKGNTLCVGDTVCALEAPERIFFIGVGKCASASAAAIEEILGGRLTKGVVLDVEQMKASPYASDKITYYAGTHPLPSQKNVEATKHILDMLVGLTPRDLVIMLISGGGSTLLCQPPEGMGCSDEAAIFKELTSRGATIQALNTVRKHLSYARGGNLVRAAYPAQVIGLIFSDVPGNSMGFIASGPTVRDTTTINDAEAVLARYGVVHDHVPFIETPKEEAYFEHVQNILLVNNMRALRAMKEYAEGLGYSARIVTDEITGEARSVAQRIASELHAAPRGTVLLYGGETTVTVINPARGNGGRNQELAIAALQYVMEGEVIMSFDSDGRDNNDSAGAIADVNTTSHAERKHVSIDEALHTHASHAFFEEVGDVVMTGATGSNVSDLIIALKN